MTNCANPSATRGPAVQKLDPIDIIGSIVVLDIGLHECERR
jgi:hypothetical protein